MPFNQNTAAGTVVYSPGEFFSGKVVANDYIIDSADSGGNLPSGGSDGATYRTPLSVSLGKYERLVFRVWLDFVVDADCDLKYKITTPSNTVSYRARRVSSEAPISGAVTEAAAWDAATSGTAETTIVAADGDSYVKLDGTITLGGTAGDVNIQVAQNTSNATASIVKFGSYFEYMKF